MEDWARGPTTIMKAECLIGSYGGRPVVLNTRLIRDSVNVCLLILDWMTGAMGPPRQV